MGKYTESPSGGDRHRHSQAEDAVKPANSGLSEGGFTRFVHRFNRNDEMRSPTTSSNDYRGQAQKVVIPKGIAGKIKP